MADIQYEGVAQIFINGRAQAQAKKVTVRGASNDQPVKTMGLGLAGFSDGAGETDIDVESAVPKKGFETSFVRHVTEKKTMSIVYKSGGTRIQVTGRFLTYEISNDVDNPAMTSGAFKGGPAKLTGG
jgi:hypothetical protein